MNANDPKSKIVPVTIDQAYKLLTDNYGTASGRDYDIMLAPGAVSLTGEPVKLESGKVAKALNSVFGFSNVAMPLDHVVKHGFESTKGLADFNGESYEGGNGNFNLPLFDAYKDGVPSYMPEGTTMAYAVINLGKTNIVDRAIAKAGMGVSFESNEVPNVMLEVLVLKQ